MKNPAHQNAMAAIPMESLKVRDNAWVSPFPLLFLAWMHFPNCLQNFSEILEKSQCLFQTKIIIKNKST